MRAKRTANLQPARTSLLALALICSPLLTSSPSSAQDIDFQNSIDATSEALIALDVKASDCLTALDSDDESQTACVDFIDAVDGELMASYLERCRLLKNWRDEYVDRSIAADLNADAAENEEMLRRLISIEYSCGENALRNRTQFVISAFDRVRGTAAGGGATGTSLDRQLLEGRFKAIEDGERRRLQDALQNQQRRSLRESERQFNDLENELLRQQIQNSNRLRNQ